MDLEERRDGKIMGRMGEGKPVEMHRKQKKDKRFGEANKVRKGLNLNPD